MATEAQRLYGEDYQMAKFLHVVCLGKIAED